jgi:hypothetical protein
VVPAVLRVVEVMKIIMAIIRWLREPAPDWTKEGW